MAVYHIRKAFPGESLHADIFEGKVGLLGTVMGNMADNRSISISFHPVIRQYILINKKGIPIVYGYGIFLHYDFQMVFCIQILHWKGLQQFSCILDIIVCSIPEIGQGYTINLNQL